MNRFGEFLHTIRSRQSASQLVKKIGISYVYLLDIEKGARTAPKDELLLALAENLQFKEGEKELFFDLAARERKSIPADVSQYIQNNAEIIDIIRKIKSKKGSVEYWRKLAEYINND